MVLKNFYSEIITLPGSFGKHEVKLSHLVPRDDCGIAALLFHGVHSSANLSVHSKYSYLANLLAARGITPWLCETSRRTTVKDKDSLSPIEWVMEIFGGKTFKDELADCETALRYVAEHTQKRLWLWGFSLGGIIAALLACVVPVDRVILSGSGAFSMPDAERDMMPLPILSTLRESISLDVLKNFAAKKITAFRGTEDAIFSSDACRALVDMINIPKESKKYFEIDGADHSFKKRNGKYDLKVMDEMLSLLMAQ
ncbi:MAG: hypothetical protein Q4E17_05880 [Synergistes sp.]|nr:hypothetical protein [Synergistes sp.]